MRSLRKKSEPFFGKRGKEGEGMFFTSAREKGGEQPGGKEEICSSFLSGGGKRREGGALFRRKGRGFSEGKEERGASPFPPFLWRRKVGRGHS